MSSLTCQEIRTMARGERQSLDIDWGDSTAGEETGALKDGDLVVSCIATVDSKPLNSADPTIGTVNVAATDLYVNSRLCIQGEYTTALVTTASNQDYGRYVFKFVATTAASFVIPRYVVVEVKQH